VSWGRYLVPKYGKSRRANSFVKKVVLGLRLIKSCGVVFAETRDVFDTKVGALLCTRIL